MALEDLKKNLRSDKMVIGTERTLKLLRQGRLSAVFMSSNCPVQVREDIAHYAKDVSVEVLDIPNDELGVVCKRPFSVSVAALLK